MRREQHADRKRLTAHGVRLLDYARQLLALNDEALASRAAPDLRGPLRIGGTYDGTEFLLPARFSQSCIPTCTSRCTPFARRIGCRRSS